MTSIVATIDKTTKDTGISFYRSEHDGTIKILNIYSGSPWCNTALAEGMIVNRINETNVSIRHSADDISELVEDCEGSLTIEARLPDDDINNTTSFPVVPTAPPATVPIPASSAAPAPPPPVVPVVVDAVVVPEESFTTNTTQPTQPNNSNTTGNGATHPHHLVPNGGYWGTNKYVGDKTQCAAICCCLFVFGIGGLLILCCPLDERPVYVVNGMVYDRTGRRLGTTNEVRVQR